MSRVAKRTGPGRTDVGFKPEPEPGPEPVFYGLDLDLDQNLKHDFRPGPNRRL